MVKHAVPDNGTKPLETARSLILDRAMKDSYSIIQLKVTERQFVLLLCRKYQELRSNNVFSSVNTGITKCETSCQYCVFCLRSNGTK